MFRLSANLFQVRLHLKTAVLHSSGYCYRRPWSCSEHEELIRCVNNVPLVTIFNGKLTLGVSFFFFLEKNAEVLTESLTNSFYPEELLVNKMTFAEVRENVNRHLQLYIQFADLATVN